MRNYNNFHYPNVQFAHTNKPYSYAEWFRPVSLAALDLFFFNIRRGTNGFYFILLLGHAELTAGLFTQGYYFTTIKHASHSGLLS